jgi:transcriptional regulator with XRE-family HTH domain
VKLKQIRNDKGLSIRSLSELSGVPQRTIEDLERRNDGRLSTFKRLASALNVTLDEIAKGDTEENNN